MKENMLGNSKALGLKHSEETKKLIGNLHKGNKHCLGYKHGSETIKKMSENNSGENNPMYGISLSKDVLLKRSLKVKKRRYI
ncbi:hypothetical protein CCP3SC1AL1_4520003 [Gammaproteobacteria bacterium]